MTLTMLTNGHQLLGLPRPCVFQNYNTADQLYK